jgi:hypothetical protein
MKILTATSAEGMRAVRSWVNTNVEKVVVVELKELLGGLQEGQGTYSQLSLGEDLKVYEPWEYWSR